MATENVAFDEVADQVYVLRYPVLDVNISLIVGPEASLVVDTLSTTAQARRLLLAARRITRLPLVLVNTHAHFDHCFGNAVFTEERAQGVPIWAHPRAAKLLRESEDQLRQAALRDWGPSSPELAQGLPNARVFPPNHEVATEVTLDLGGRYVVLHHPGPGHTDGDLTVLVPDAAVIIAGDLVEESGPPQFDDGFPLQWPDTLTALLDRTPEADLVVPGHGAVVDREFVVCQQHQLELLANQIRQGHRAGEPVESVADRSPFGPAGSTVAVIRGYEQLGERQADL